jgi:hypothetical protein
MATQEASPDVTAVLHEMQETQSRLLATIEALSSKLDSVAQTPYADASPSHIAGAGNISNNGGQPGANTTTIEDPNRGASSLEPVVSPIAGPASPTQRHGLTSRIILT